MTFSLESESAADASALQPATLPFSDSDLDASSDFGASDACSQPCDLMDFAGEDVEEQADVQAALPALGDPQSPSAAASVQPCCDAATSLPTSAATPILTETVAGVGSDNPPTAVDRRHWTQIFALVDAEGS